MNATDYIIYNATNLGWVSPA